MGAETNSNQAQDTIKNVKSDHESEIKILRKKRANAKGEIPIQQTARMTGSRACDEQGWFRATFVLFGIILTVGVVVVAIIPVIHCTLLAAHTTVRRHVPYAVSGLADPVLRPDLAFRMAVVAD